MINPIRFGGLASGLDTDQIVKDLMKAESMPLNKLKQKKQLEEWKRSDYRDMNSLLLDLRTTVLDMKLQGTYLKSKVTSSNEQVVSATAKSGSINATTQINVSQLAEVSYTTSSAPISASSASKINPDSILNTQISKFQNGTFENNFKLKVFQPDGTFKEQQFTIDPATESLNDVLKKINSSTLGVTAYYDATTDKVSLSTNHTGDNTSGNEIEIVSGTFMTNTLKLGAANTGKNAKFKLNGLDTERTSNQFTINGIEYSLKTSGSATVTANADVDAVFESIKNFVDKYNDVIGKVNAKITEKKYRDYQPLLDEEREQLSDTQEEQWEEKAKSGLLKQDSLLSNALTGMRRALSSPVSGVIDPKFDTLSEIGITTGSYEENGKLYIDETKLRNAISQNGNKVMELFTNTTTATDSTQKFKESGIAQRLYDHIDNSMDKITEKAGSILSLTDNSLLGKSIQRIDDDIYKWESRLMDIEDRYWRKFTAMEKAMNQANSQSAWLAQQLGGQ